MNYLDQQKLRREMRYVAMYFVVIALACAAIWGGLAWLVFRSEAATVFTGVLSFVLTFGFMWFNYSAHRNDTE